MSFFPIISAPGCLGRTTVFNFPPNNWEFKSRNNQFVILTWLEDSFWHSVTVDELIYGEIKSYQISDFHDYLPASSLPLLSLSPQRYSTNSKLLPFTSPSTYVPSWRATIELYTPLSSSSYQGEIDPFPVPSSLLSFSPLIQTSENICNYLLLLNIEKEAKRRISSLKIFNASTSRDIIRDFTISNNNLNVICLDHAEYNPLDLSVIICTDMSAIPIYLSKAVDGSCLSLEHTHPPASYFIHGQRWLAQRSLKRRWFSSLLQK